MATFKNEKQWRDWLAANPAAAARVRSDQVAKAAAAAAPVIRESMARIREQGSVVVRLPQRAAAPVANPYRPLASRFDRAMAWVFVALVGVGALGAWGCVCALLALEYVR